MLELIQLIDVYGHECAVDVINKHLHHQKTHQYVKKHAEFSIAEEAAKRLDGENGR